MSEQPTKNVPIGELRTEPGSEELVRSDSMKPYLEVLKAEMGGCDSGPPWQRPPAEFSARNPEPQNLQWCHGPLNETAAL